jgi:acetyl esterase/lipase
MTPFGLRLLKQLSVLAVVAASIAAPYDSFAAKAPTKSVHVFKIKYGQQAGQFGELWLPNDYEEHPVAVLIHGGCWSLPANLNDLNLMAENLQESGFAVWNLEFRRIGMEGGGYPGSFQDIGNGLDILRKMKDTYKLDLSRIVLVGKSSGGHLALWAAGRKHIKPDSKLYVENPLPVKAVVSLGGIGDLGAFRNARSGCGFKMVDYLVNVTQRTAENYYADTSPLFLLPLGVKEILVHTEKDPMAPKKPSLVYAKKAKDSGDEVEYYTIEDAGPNALITPKSKAWRHVKELIANAVK